MNTGKSEAAVSSGAASRNPAIDFTKGLLVVLMLVYHWMNYFVGVEGFYYRYLRFVTPSFIVMSGFMITGISRLKYAGRDGRQSWKLLRRGLKLLALFVVLNMGAGLAGAAFAWGDLPMVLVSGRGGASFMVLVPIAYSLVVAAGLLALERKLGCPLALAAGAVFLGLAAAEVLGHTTAVLDLLSFGILGTLIGLVSVGRIDRLRGHILALLAAYVLYLVGITFWGVPYGMQVVGVCLNLALIYWLGLVMKPGAALNRCVLLLGRYSLVGYVVQIALLNVLLRVVGRVGGSPAVSLACLLIALALMQAVVAALDYARARAKAVDRAYAAVFS